MARVNCRFARNPMRSVLLTGVYMVNTVCKKYTAFSTVLMARAIMAVQSLKGEDSRVARAK